MTSILPCVLERVESSSAARPMRWAKADLAQASISLWPSLRHGVPYFKAHHILSDLQRTAIGRPCLSDQVSNGCGWHSLARQEDDVGVRGQLRACTGEHDAGFGRGRV